MRPIGSPVVVKIGGSYAGRGALQPTLCLLMRLGRPLVLVPGGGAYADAVRADQSRLGFSDLEAHARALAAMERMAGDMVAMQPGLVAAAGLRAIEAAVAAGRVPVWLPTALARQARDLPASWQVTSDALAAWLAARLGAVPVVLMKSCHVARGVPPEVLARRGVTDQVFPHLVAKFRLPWAVLGPRQIRHLATGLDLEHLVTTSERSHRRS